MKNQENKVVEDNLVIANENLRLNIEDVSVKKSKKVPKKEHEGLETEVSSLRYVLEDAQNKMRSMEEELEKFKADFEDRKLKFAMSIIDQRAFMELAIQYGRQLGKNSFEVKKEGYKKEIDVLENKHEAIHQTNATPLMSSMYEKLIESINCRHYVFQNECIPLVLEGKIHVLGDEQYTYWFEALSDWLNLAKDGNKEAQQNIIECFANGYGTDVDLNQAEYWKQRLEGKSHEDIMGKDIKKQVLESNESNQEIKNIIEEKELLEQKTNEDINQDKEFLEKINAEKLEIFEKLRMINVGYPQSSHYLSRLMSLEKEDKAEFSEKVNFYGSALCLHHADFIFEVSNIKNHGSFLRSDKRGDLTMTIVNNSDWEPDFFIKIEDESGRKTRTRYKVVKGETSGIKLLTAHKIGTKIKCIEFETVEEKPKNYIVIPKKLIIE
jgi:hypothetical protein